MKIVREGDVPENAVIYNGQCHNCKAIIECFQDEVSYSPVDRHLYVECPTPHCKDHIIVIEGKWMGQWVDPKFKQKDWYMTPTVPAELEAKENNG